MPRRPWEATTTALIVLAGLQGTPGADMCTAYQMSPSLYYPWRDPCVAHAAQAVADPQRTRKAARLEQENARRKPLVGALTFAVNTSDERLA